MLKLDDGDESSFYQGWSSALYDKNSNKVKTLVIGERVWLLDNRKFDSWIVRNGFSIENRARQTRKIEYNTDLKMWVVINKESTCG